MENSKALNETESLELIGKMIRTVKNDLEDSSFYYLIWGWLVFTASLLNFYLIYSGYDKPYLPWVILMPAGAIVTIIYSSRKEKKHRVKTYTDEIMKYVLIAFLVSLFIVLGFMSRLGLATYPMVMMVYAVWLFISGGALRFTPLIAGGIINWVLGITAFFFEFEIQLLLLAFAVLLGYIIPGHLLRRKNEKQAGLQQASV